MQERIRKYANLQKLLDEKGITAYRLATDTQISPMTLSDWKNGKSIPKADKLVAIANYLGTTVEELIKQKGVEEWEKLSVLKILTFQ